MRVLLLAVAALCATPTPVTAALPLPSYRGPRPFTQSRAYSAGKTTQLPREPVLDLAVDEQLEEVLSKRMYNKELLLFVFDAREHCRAECDGLRRSWLEDALAMVAQLNDIGFAHYVALAAHPNACQELHDNWPSDAGPGPSCVVSSALGNRTGNSNWGHHLDVLQLWAARYYTIVELAKRGVHVFMHDMDMIFHRDPYADLYSPPLDKATLVCLGEGPCNGGMMYVRDPHPDGGALWVLRQIERRDTLARVLEQTTGTNPGLVMDQNVLGDALRVSTTNSSTWDWWDTYEHGHKEHPFWTEHPQSQPALGFQWRPWGDATYTAPAVLAGCPYPNHTDVCARWETAVKKHDLQDKPVMHAVMHVPPDEPVRGPSEVIMMAPQWTFTHGTFSQLGWNYDRGLPMPITAMTHLLGTDLDFAETMIGSHTGRFVQAHAGGYLSPVALMGTNTMVRLLHLDQALVDEAANSSTSMPLRDVLRQFSLMAVSTGLLPVMPQVPCFSPWVTRSDESPWGLSDRRLVMVGTALEPQCFVAASGWDSCWGWMQVAFAFDELARPESRNVTTVEVPLTAAGKVHATAWLGLVREAAPADVRVTTVADMQPHKELRAEQALAMESFTKDCPTYVCPDHCKRPQFCDAYSGKCQE